MTIYAEDSDSKIIKMLEANGSQLCLEAAHRISYYSDENECEVADDIPYPNYIVSHISGDNVYLSGNFGNLRLSSSDITGHFVQGTRIIIGESGKFKVWEK